MFHFISGYTSKIAGTEEGIVEPQATFSACFGSPFMPLHPTIYANMLGKKMEAEKVKVWLINTGWSGGGYGEGKRISLKHTRAIIDSVINNTIDAEYTEHPIFGLHMPTKCENVPNEILDPINTWKNKDKYTRQAKKLAKLFHANFTNMQSSTHPVSGINPTQLNNILLGGPKQI